MKFTIKTIFPITAQKLYKAWLNSDQHSAMTGSNAICSSEIGGLFSSWDGYINGKNIELIANKKIKQSWRTTDFSEDDEDSIIEINFKNVKSGCEIVLTHSKIPKVTANYKTGWDEYYFQPMKEYFK